LPSAHIKKKRPIDCQHCHHVEKHSLTTTKTMTLEEKVRCERECSRLCQDFVYSIDHRHYEDFLQLFGPDPWLDRAGQRFQGLDGLRAFCGGRASNRYVRHICSNIRIDPIDRNTAKGTSCATMYHGTAEPDTKLPLPTSMPLIAEYVDAYVLTDTGWRIQSRKVIIVFQP
jgi:hypothetical protein